MRGLPLDRPLVTWTEEELDRYFDALIRWVMRGRRARRRKARRAA